MAVNRNEGYDKGRLLGPIGERVAADFVEYVTATGVSLVKEEEANYRVGDLRVGDSKQSIEVKSQGIDPTKYNLNFVEVFEDMSESKSKPNPNHADGFAQTAKHLSMSEDDLAEVEVRDCRSGPPIHTGPLGRPVMVSASLTSIAGSVATIYTNNHNRGNEWLYLYRSPELLRLIRNAVRQGLDLGRGISNDRTYSVRVRVPETVWRRNAPGWFPYQRTSVGAGWNAITKAEVIERSLSEAKRILMGM